MSRSIYVRNRFAWRSYNQTRIDRALEINPEPGKIAFHVIPFLLHVNQPGLPGHHDTVPPACGVALYEPSGEAERALKRWFSGLNIAQALASVPRGEPIIQSVMLMGSVGTAAQTRISDFDYWIVIDESKLDKNMIDLLTAKFDAIERWSADRKMEVHFFLTDIEKAKRNDFGDTDKESAGSSQAHVLKEEFYRTAILAAGKDPMWWVFPPDLTNEAYEKHKRALTLEGYVGENEVVDLGNVQMITTDELFGALLWQFNKAITSPHKAALKMALLESFINSSSSERLLCDTLKRAIQKHPDKTGQADPYLLMFDSIRRHYLKSGRKKWVPCLEKCFYIKSLDLPAPSAKGVAEPPYKQRTLLALIKRWKWPEETAKDINRFGAWDYQRITQLGADIHSFMLETYKDLTGDITPDMNAKAFITEKDLTVLGRKLFTIYDRRNGSKIEYIKRVTNELKNVEAVTLTVSAPRSRSPVWTVFQGDVRSSAAKGEGLNHFLLKKGPDPVSLMMWLVWNEIYAKGTYLYYIPDSQFPVALKDFQSLMRRLKEFFPPVVLSDLKNDDLLQRSYVTRVFVAINLLSPRWNKEIDRLHIIYATSWGEAFCETLATRPGLAKLTDALRQTSAGFSLIQRDIFEVFAPKGESATILVSKLKQAISKKFKPAARDASPII